MAIVGWGLASLGAALWAIEAVIDGLEGPLWHHAYWIFIFPYAMQVVHQLLWRWFGRESVRVIDDELTIEHSIGGWAWKRTIALDAVERFHGNIGSRPYWYHNDWPRKEESTTVPTLKCPAVRFELSGRRRDECFAAGIAPAEVRRIGEALARHTGKPWVDSLPRGA